MAGQTLPSGLREGLLFLGTAAVAVPVFLRLRISPVLGFLMAGVVLGPFGLGGLAQRIPWLAPIGIAEPGTMAEAADFGVVFLLFMVGLELSLERLTRLRALVFGLGALQVGLSTAGIALAAALLGLAPGAAVAVGFALALSSTAVAVPVLAERRRLGTTAGRSAFSVLLFQDLAVAPLLFTLTALTTPREGGIGFGLVLSLAPAAAALCALVVAGRLVLRPLFHLVAATRSTEFFMAACLLVVIGTGAVTAMSGLSMSLGAFIAGLLLAETEFRREIEVTIEPFKGLLLGLFFVSIGVGLDLSTLAESLPAVIALSIGIIAFKAGLLFVLGRLFALSWRAALEMALVLGPSGEFAFVMINQATGQSLVPEPVARLLLGVVTLTMMAIPLIARLAESAVRRKAAPQEPPEPPPEDGTARIIIVGFGRVGRLVADMVEQHELPFLAVDDDAALVRRTREAGVPIYWGDATRRDFLHRCGLGTARALVVTVSSAAVTERVVEAARAERADLTIVARARDADHARTLYDLGATDAIPETIEASLQLSEAVLVDVGVPMGYVIASIHGKRDEFRALLNQKSGEEIRERRAIRRPSRPRT